MRRILPVFGLFFFSLLLSGCTLKKAPLVAPPAELTPAPTKLIEETIKERPYVSLLPTTDGYWVTIDVKKIVKGTTGLEYELTYFADFEDSKIERGVSTGGKPVELFGATDYSKKILFGSASCTTGVCKYKYDENVNEGMFSLKLIGEGKTEKYETVFRIQSGKEAKEGFSTGDGIFGFVSSALPGNSLYLIASSIGLPVPLPEGVTVKSNPYAIFPSISAKGTVSIKTDLPEAVIYAFDGKAWKKLTTKIASGEASAETSGNFLFLLAQ